MKIRFLGPCLYASSLLVFVSSLPAQDLEPHFRKIKDGIYVQSAKPGTEDGTPANANCGIILTQEGWS